MVCYRNTCQHAGPFRRLPARKDKRTYGRPWCVTEADQCGLSADSFVITAVFGLLQIVAFTELIRSHVSSRQFRNLLFVGLLVIGILGALAFAGLTYKGWIAPWTGRFYSLWDTGYAKKCVACIVRQVFSGCMR